ncbi:hypothetical protein [Geobacter sp. SVR]|uniref:phosphorylase family protein n=1 Tax=Geobacter sp. SVR TaxID=2495594 RepID=UPI00143F04FD|nr:hypothetical protein [Geobacter sp. SVR]BCS51733.1 MTA/SAH nucleosidase [Geobacter sp. SVR]GCF84920.1 MTA/SAH nucleosidase [Geobacter sp. SVR]
MNIGIITAMPEETAAVLKMAHHREKSRVSGRNRYRCQISGHDIELIETGMGMLNAGWGALALAGQRPDLMISTGFGGGILPGLAVGDVVMAGQVLHWVGDGFEAVPVGLYGLNSMAEVLSLPCGTFISCDAILDKTSLLPLLPSGANYPVVEMETAAVARVAAAQGIPFLGLRSISDPWDEELAFSIDDFCDETKRIRIIKVIATIIRRPGIVPQLLRLARNSRLAAAGLARSMERLLETI